MKKLMSVYLLASVLGITALVAGCSSAPKEEEAPGVAAEVPPPAPAPVEEPAPYEAPAPEAAAPPADLGAASGGRGQ